MSYEKLDSLEEKHTGIFLKKQKIMIVSGYQQTDNAKKVGIIE